MFFNFESFNQYFYLRVPQWCENINSKCLHCVEQGSYCGITHDRMPREVRYWDKCIIYFNAFMDVVINCQYWYGLIHCITFKQEPPSFLQECSWMRGSAVPYTAILLFGFANPIMSLWPIIRYWDQWDLELLLYKVLLSLTRTIQWIFILVQLRCSGWLKTSVQICVIFKTTQK